MKTTAALAAALALLAAPACGPSAALDAGSARDVTVTMGDFWFETSDSVFVAGTPYRFVLRNQGLMAHEWAVVPRGDADESRMLTEVEEDDLPPGATAVHVFTFADAGEFDFACFLPGHYEGGMVLPVRVRAAE